MHCGRLASVAAVQCEPRPARTTAARWNSAEARDLSGRRSQAGAEGPGAAVCTGQGEG